jgi:hypothetical protein
MISSSASGILASASAWTVIDTYTIGAYTVSTDEYVVKRGPFRGSLGLEPVTCDITISTGGTGGPLAALRASALGGGLDNAEFTYTRTYVGGGDVLRFTGTVQRVEPASATLRVVAISETVKLRAVQLPSRIITPTDFPEIPPPENYNVR